MDTAAVSDDGTVSTTTSSITISSVASTNSTSTTLDVDDFLQLLVTQMQYQDPLEPSDNTQYIAQMATFSQVEATTEMQSTVEQQMASNLVGQTVMVKTDSTTSGYMSGTVNYWQNIDGTIYLGIEGGLYDIKDLDTVIDEDYYQKYLDLIEDTDSDTSTDSDSSTDTSSDSSSSVTTE